MRRNGSLFIRIRSTLTSHYGDLLLTLVFADVVDNARSMDSLRSNFMRASQRKQLSLMFDRFILMFLLLIKTFEMSARSMRELI